MDADKSQMENEQTHCLLSTFLFCGVLSPNKHMRVEQKVLNRGLHCEGPGVCSY